MLEESTHEVLNTELSLGSVIYTTSAKNIYGKN
jgi:hypothetical protein